MTIRLQKPLSPGKAVMALVTLGVALSAAADGRDKPGKEAKAETTQQPGQKANDHQEIGLDQLPGF